jgi:hypothetical protein
MEEDENQLWYLSIDPCEQYEEQRHDNNYILNSVLRKIKSLEKELSSSISIDRASEKLQKLYNLVNYW